VLLRSGGECGDGPVEVERLCHFDSSVIPCAGKGDEDAVGDLDVAENGAALGDLDELRTDLGDLGHWARSRAAEGAGS